MNTPDSHPDSLMGLQTLIQRLHSNSSTAASASLVFWRRLMCFGVAVTLLISGYSANAQTITVTMCRDVIDVPSTATIADLPGPDGKVSMNEALRASDNTPGVQTIAFAIPQSEWWLPNIFPGRVLLQSTFGWSAQEPVIIDGTTQTAFTGDTNPDGWEMGLDGLGLGLNGDNSELFGFHGCNVGLGGNNSVIHDNTGKMDISVGPFNSGCVIRDNDADTIAVTYSDNNLVIRNVAERVRITGLNGTDLATGNRIGGPDPADHNFITGWGNVGEHGSVHGVTVELFNTDDTLIQNNYIGTTPDGMAIGNNASTVGVGVYNQNHNLTVRDNLIAIQAYWGGGNSGQVLGAPIYLQMYMGGSNIRILGNTLGLNALGEPVLGSAQGIWVGRYAFEYGADNVRIGGPNPGEGNIIAGHRLMGVGMEYTWGPSIGYIRLSGNSIYANGEIGIDLMPNTSDFGPTPNDPLDADVGANGLQNYPDIFAATSSGQSIQVVGQLHSEPTSEYTLEFFASSECGAGGLGQAEVFLGSTSAITDTAGNAPFDVTLPVAVPNGWMISSTATLEPIGTTSEFSDCVTIGGETFADSFDITRGTFVSGSITDLMESDDLDVTARRNTADVSSRVYLEVSGVSPTQMPSTLELKLEASVFARSPVIQSLDLYNYVTDSWEEIGSTVASRFSDATTIAAATGDLSRFVQAGTGRIEARCRYESASARQQFSASVDKIAWLISN